MLNNTKPGRRRGRPPSGNKPYCVRMPPETHDLLMEEAKWHCSQENLLTSLLEMFAATWTAKKKYLESNNVAIDSPEATRLLSAYDAKEALDNLVTFFQADPSLAVKHKTALVELRELCERLIKLMNKNRPKTGK